ncbi:MAG: hypothetical protein Q7R47_03435, partial [Candidatus Diapherotrites archaeon]|nr:hypothetical protein [Candidatus Diapherotrites archaeon]
VFDRLYGPGNYYLEIKPKLLNLRLFFVLDGSENTQDEADQLLETIPAVVKAFREKQYTVYPRVFILAGGPYGYLDPCDQFRNEDIQCDYVYEEQLYKDAVAHGWLRHLYNWRSWWNAKTNFLKDFNLVASQDYAFDQSWSVTPDEFLDDSDVLKDPSTVNRNNPKLFDPYFAGYCSWVYLESVPSVFEITPVYSSNQYAQAYLWVNGQFFNSVLNTQKWKIAEPLTPTVLQVGWNKFCFGYSPGGLVQNTNFNPQIDYKITRSDTTRDYFSSEELHAFYTPPPSDVTGFADAEIPRPGGTVYKDWASGSVYAALQGLTSDQSVVTMIIPFSNQLSAGSAPTTCPDNLVTLNDYLCQVCQPASPDACPVDRSKQSIDYAITKIVPTGDFVFPVL